MLNILKSLFAGISGPSFKDKLDGNTDKFLSEINYINLVRLRIISLVAFTLFVLLWIWDIVQFFDAIWGESAGYQVVTYFHSFLIIFLAGVYIFCRKKTPEDSHSIETFHEVFINSALAIVLFCTVFLAFGDVLTNGSIAAYLGMVFAYASIFLMTNLYSLILFGANMIIMVFLLVMVYVKSGQPMNIQIINTVAFTIVAYILSRVLFYYNQKDFTNLLVIEKQANEISQKNKTQEQLIYDLKKALSEVKTLQGILPICSHCKKIRDDKGYWNQVEAYIHAHSDAQFSHGICPECMKKHYPGVDLPG